MEWQKQNIERQPMDRHSRQPSAASYIPATEDTVWADVSTLLEAACGELRDGELIHGENFNLFAAMSALEIMDPKMDSGIINRYCSVDEAIEDGAAPIPISFDKTTDVQCTIDIMDHLLACEATWHRGHSLAQTVFSCIYLLKPERTASHPLLDSYCKVIRATCKAVVSVVSETRTHEEEDLFTMAYGLPLCGDGDEKCLSLLNAVEENISRQLRACRAPSSKRKILEDVEPLQTNLDLEEGYCKALLCRIRFRKHFFHLLTCMRRPQGRGMELARKHITACISELESIYKSAEFLFSNAHGACKDDMEGRTTASGHRPIGFDATLNSRTSAPTPPRSIELLSWKKAIEYFEKLLHDLDYICSYSLDPSLEVLLRFVVQFQKSQPDLVARAHLQLLLVQDGRLYGRDSIFAVIIRAAVLPEVVKNNDIQKNECILQLGQLVINMLKILCTNAAWQRRKLGKVLQDWRILYVQLELAFTKEYREVSNTSNGESVSLTIFKHILIWLEEQTYWIAHRFLMLGFELDLYSPGEYCMVYWYLYVILIKLAEKTHLKMSATNSTAKRKGKKRKDSPKDLTRESRIPPAVLFLQCQICLAEGLTLLLAALRNELRILQSPSPFNSEHERFIQHFELLQKACIPDHFSYPSFQESTSYASFSTIATYNYFKDAQKIAKEVKSSFSNDPDRLAEVRRLEQVAEHNSIALNVICQVGALDPSLKVSFEFIHHPCFATAVVKRS
ncbi:N-alpha-acetyltransferase 35, NatC auxiliary subunit [Ricinus communis]|uniref:Acetyltransferase, putative n=1 Tax=Ricinus communis TaxID=3988 RepID=B9T127_RICCO|nr:N-alpha-acetyltransferase 35, NatC auxiliary subunit [Ricinus communis]EEF30428.1 acetyltransferase, putative [Ricinus communis]|eukprot:XP_002531946.1 N-alpha-acetyltransferase 35, NatC auxiliary subunit [Ricinus communis]